MATTITAGSDSGIALDTLKSIAVYPTSLKVVWTYADGTTHTTTGADATDFIAHGLPYIGGQAQVSYYKGL
jgi:hypothetical protein